MLHVTRSKSQQLHESHTLWYHGLRTKPEAFAPAIYIIPILQPSHYATMHEICMLASEASDNSLGRALARHIQLRLRAGACGNTFDTIHAAKPPLRQVFAKGSHRDEYNSAAVSACSGSISVRMLHRLQTDTPACVRLKQGARLTQHSTAWTPGHHL